MGSSDFPVSTAARAVGWVMDGDIRRFQDADLHPVMDVYQASVHGLAATYYSPSQIAAWAPVNPCESRWSTRLAGVTTLVASIGGRVVGFVSFTSAGYVDLLFVHPTVSRRGVATALYRAVEAAFRELGCRVATTHASLVARAFFERQGFRVILEEEVECRGERLRRFSMEKPLTCASSAGGERPNPRAQP